jgi:hypothetical protein
MKALLPIPLAIGLTMAIGYGLCQAGGWNVHPRDMAVAAVVAGLAVVLACVPMILVRGASQSAVAQAALAGTVIQLLMCLLLAGLVWAMKRIGEPTAFGLWLLAFYWGTLAAMVVGMSRQLRAAGTNGPTVS